jgi:hypothetical protein
VKRLLADKRQIAKQIWAAIAVCGQQRASATRNALLEILQSVTSRMLFDTLYGKVPLQLPLTG